MGLWGFLASCHNLVCSRLGKDSCLRKQDGQKQLRSPSACHMGTHKHPPQRVYTHGSVHTQPPTDTNTLYLEKEKKKNMSQSQRKYWRLKTCIKSKRVLQSGIWNRLKIQAQDWRYSSMTEKAPGCRVQGHAWVCSSDQKKNQRKIYLGHLKSHTKTYTFSN